MRLNDRIIGLVAIVGGVGVLVGTLGFRDVPGQQFGSAFFPRLLGIAIIIAGLAVTLTARRGDLVRIEPMLRGRSGLKVMAALCGAVAWVWLAPLIGFIPATAILIAALATLAGGATLPSVATGIGMSFVLFLIFGLLLRVPLPAGVVERLLS